MSAPVIGGKASFALRGHNPDVLTCIANLSNDEVFTPPELANQMLDTVEQAWAESNGGASIWADPDVTFLDPFTKSGVFLREITRRLTDGLASQIPNLEERVNHILTKQVYGIGITKLTALLARRSVYCSKDATGTHSIARSFDRDWGNVWFERTDHTWAGEKCAYCGAQRERFVRDDALESHAYAFIHTTDITARLSRMFGADVQFDVIIGNPPYQMTGAAGGSSDASIYHHFVEQAQRLEPRLLSMVIPSRWMAGGRGLDDFRRQMLTGSHLRSLTDYADSSDAFPGVQIKGGICHFLWDSAFQGAAEVRRLTSEGWIDQSDRDLGEFDVFVRDARAVAILRKVLSFAERPISEMLSGDTPFGIATNYAGHHPERTQQSDLELHLIVGGKRTVRWMPRTAVTKQRDAIDRWKVLLPKAYGAGEATPHQILGRAIVAGPGSVCSQTYIIAWPFLDQAEAVSFASYYRTRLFRFLVSLRKITQDALRGTYSWVPQLSWDRAWTDEELYERYGITEEEIVFIESQVRAMDPADA
ncbi:Eco57I restriction-modification methylase domain-containing protein [Microbacterium thalli]|uniref:site-specific DNA-methyltransferase (adenine-specific) n=1 Tax=Microbacterium thalli TaxID=3027921 RepID=A0ABT5SH45_9MICO|nr:Eco57I restriction-modification methylase domain-containing protein [Microbacterium thalli]MDD7961397.1 Eco57I restriction-modification methylase domain-containing protein [Microbacterium thalli]